MVQFLILAGRYREFSFDALNHYNACAGIIKCVLTHTIDFVASHMHYQNQQNTTQYYFIRYRFADEPISKSKGKDDTEPKQRTFYTGKVQVEFRSDGYTDLISNRNEQQETQVQFQKVWGWDIETSNEDKLDYLLFSADVQLPRLPSGILPMPERFYFQARVDKNSKDKISLQDGSVTVKRNVESGTGGWWGLFRGADGILAEFREVGLFRCKAVARDGQQ